jgi:endoribonuclease LACTB2
MKKRVVTDSMIGMDLPDIDQWSDLVTVVLGQNPGMFSGPGTNTYIIGSSARPLLVDTGQGIESYLPLLRQAMRERGAEGLQEIVLTHAHPDHNGGIEQVFTEYGELRVTKMPRPELDGAIDVTALGDEDVVVTEGATLQAIWTPGHARDHLCFYIPEDRALITGDVVLGAGTTVIPPDGDLGDYIRSLHRLLDFDADVLYPAHGPRILNPREKIESYLAHRALRDEQILEGLKAGIETVPDLVKRIYTDVPEYLHGAAGMSVDAHLRNLLKEGMVQRRGERWALA